MAGQAFRFALALLAGIVLVPVFAIASLVPRRTSLWLFGGWFGTKYSDNPRWLLEHILRNRPDIQPVWIAKDRALCNWLEANGVPHAYAWSFQGILHQLRARVVVFTHAAASEFVAPLLGARILRVQAWHGMPIKRIGYDDEKDTNLRLRQRIRGALLPYDTDRNDLVIAGSEADAEKYRSAFNVHPSRVRITGYPRNDALLRGSRDRRPQPGAFRALYVPTFRGKPGSEFELLSGAGLAYRAADAALEAMGCDLYIKLHPVQRFSEVDRVAIESARRIHTLPASADVYTEAAASDVLITDFSSIFFDFLITGKPIIMAPFEIERYLARDRSLYYRYEDICPDLPCSSWEAVLERLGEKSRDGGRPTERYLDLQGRFHRYLDAESSARVVSEIAGLLAERGSAAVQQPSHQHSP